MPTQLALSVIDARRPELHTRDISSSRSYRLKVTIPKVTFSLGWELEANVSAARVPAGVHITSDGSVHGDSTEYVVMPMLVKSIQYVLGLLKQLVHSPRLNTDGSCGFHIHISPQNVPLKKMRQWAMMMQWLAKQVEAEAWLAVPESRQSNSYCKKIELLSPGVSFASTKYNNPRRYEWVNMVEMFRPSGIRTVEIRLLGNTHRWKYLLAWSTFCLELSRSAWKLLYAPLEIEKEIQHLKASLTFIATEIKPLEKRNETIPEAVFRTLQSFGIHNDKWDRPLAELAKSEAKIKGYRSEWYSDHQPISEPENSDDGVCGHGNDRDENGCEECDHGEGNCEPRHCLQCQRLSHQQAQLCAFRMCRRCNERRLTAQVFSESTGIYD